MSYKKYFKLKNEATAKRLLGNSLLDSTDHRDLENADNLLSEAEKFEIEARKILERK